MNNAICKPCSQTAIYVAVGSHRWLFVSNAYKSIIPKLWMSDSELETAKQSKSVLQIVALTRNCRFF